MAFLVGCIGVIACESPADLADASNVDAGSSVADAGRDASIDAAAQADADIEGDAGVDFGPECALTDMTIAATDSGMRVLHRAGQSFITWTDRAEAEAGAAYRYQVYRSSEPLTSDTSLVSAELIAEVLNRSGQLFGTAFRPDQRLEPEAAMSIVEEGSAPLAPWSGLAVSTARFNGCAFYAVLATDVDGAPVESIVPGVNTTRLPVAERVATRVPIKVYDSAERGIYSPQTEVTGTIGLPLMVRLHASNAGGGGAGEYGDYFLYFGDRSMGYQDGLPGVFSVEETHSGPQTLLMRNRDTIIDPNGAGGIETLWFGYVTEPLYGGERFAYPFTENRLQWMIPWVVDRYEVDPERVYAEGGSMGAWGSVTFAYRRPDVFAAVFPNRPRFRQVSMRAVGTSSTADDTLPSGELWSEHHDSVAWVARHPESLPFLGWAIGRRDGFATWQEQVDMVEALTAGRHGFALSWNDGDHSTGVAAMAEISRWYPPSLFARNQSYPAFSNSSIDDDMGTGDPLEGDLVGGINLGFAWTLLTDSDTEWSVELSNALASAEMSVDVSARRLQSFQIAPAQSVEYEVSLAGAVVDRGVIEADAQGLATLEGLALLPDQVSTLTLRHGE